MSKIGVFYGSDTGCTEAVIAKIEGLIPEDLTTYTDVSTIKDKNVSLKQNRGNYYQTSNYHKVLQHYSTPPKIPWRLELRRITQGQEAAVKFLRRFP